MTPPELADDDAAGMKLPWHVRWTPLLVLMAGMVGAASVLMMSFVAGGETRRADVAEVQAEKGLDLAAEVERRCRAGGDLAAELGALCRQAQEVQNAPVHEARDGAPGRGIAGTAISPAGHLVITYTDGKVEDKGPVVGHGVPGRGILASTVQNGALVLSYSDGTTETVGPVVGAAGRDGEDGAPGRGITSVAISADFRLLVTYTDGDTVDVGPLPAGPAGRGITGVAFDLETCTATVTYTDGASEQAPMTGCDQPDPEDPADPPGGLIPGGDR